MTHNCYRCGAFKMEYHEMRTILKTAIRQMENRPGTPQAADAAERVTYAKARIEEVRDRWDIHLAQVESEPPEPEKPRRILDIQRPKAKPAPKPQRTTIDREALALVLAAPVVIPPEKGHGTNTLPATGHCHTCDRTISGQRRFCGRCMAKRSA